MNPPATPSRYVVVNADDLGLSADVNRGIIQAHENGIVTSASLMVRYPAAQDAARYHREGAKLGIGLHAEFGEWTLKNWEWVPVYQLVDIYDADAAEKELREQVSRFFDLIGHGPTHLDSHQHVHRKEPIRSIMIRVAEELGVPLRGHSRFKSVGEFYGKTWDNKSAPDHISAERLADILSRLPEGTSELTCHPGYSGDIQSDYREERDLEVTALCSEMVRQTIRELGLTLARFDTALT